MFSPNPPFVPNAPTPSNCQQPTGVFDQSTGLLTIQANCQNGQYYQGITCGVASAQQLGTYLSCPATPTNIAAVNKLVADVNRAGAKSYAEITTPTVTVPAIVLPVASNSYNLFTWLILLIIIIVVMVLVDKNYKK